VKKGKEMDNTCDKIIVLVEQARQQHIGTSDTNLQSQAESVGFVPLRGGCRDFRYHPFRGRYHHQKLAKRHEHTDDDTTDAEI